MIDDQELDARLRNAPTTGRPPTDPWPEIERRTLADGRTHRRFSRALSAAAAVLVFTAGAVSGVMADRWGNAPDPRPRLATTVSPELDAAVRIQAAGSAYVAAVGALRSEVVERPDIDPLAVSQGYEAALAAIEAVSEVWAADGPSVVDASELFSAATRARRSMAGEVSRMLDQGGGR